MKKSILRTIASLLIVLQGAPLYPAPLYRLPHKDGGSMDPGFFEFLSKERERLGIEMENSVKIEEELRRLSVEEIEGLLEENFVLDAETVREERDLLRRSFRNFSELFIRQYVTRESEAERRRAQEKELFGTDGGESYLSHGEYGLHRLLEAERTLVEERLAWERQRDAEYGESLSSFRADHRELLDGKEVWQGELEKIISRAVRWRQRELEELSHGWAEKEKEMRWWNETHREPYVGAVADSVRLAEESSKMIGRAQLEIYRNGADAYWEQVEEEFSAFRAEAMEKFESLILEELKKISVPEENLLFQAERELAAVREEVEIYEALLGRSEGESREPPHTTEEWKGLTSSLLQMERRGELTKVLEGELLRAEDAYEAAKDRVHRLGSNLETLSTESAVSSELRDAFEREERVSSLLQSLSRERELLEAKIEKRTRELQRNRERHASTLYDLFLVPAGGRGTGEEGPSFHTTAEQWLGRMSEGYSEETASSLLKDFALAYGHEGGNIDPGYASSNPTYGTLKKKIGSSGEEHLSRQQARAYNRVMGDPEKRELYDFYQEYLDTRDEASEGSLLYRAAVEDLGESLFEGIDSAAGSVYRGLKKDEGIFNKQAKVLAASAAAMTALFNFSAAVALAAAAVAARMAAKERSTQAKDIKALRKNLRAADMTGRDERAAFSGLLSDYTETLRVEEDIEEELGLLTVERRSMGEWKRAWEVGDRTFDYGRLTRENRDFFLDVNLRDIGTDGPSLEEEKIGAVEFLQIAEALAEQALAEAREERRHAWELEYRGARWSKKRGLLRHALLETEVDKKEEYASELFSLRASREYRSFIGRKEEEMERVEERQRRWNGFVETVSNHSGGYWESLIEDVHGSSQSWEEEFRREYENNEKLWDRRHGKLHSIAGRLEKEGLRKRLESWGRAALQAAGLKANKLRIPRSTGIYRMGEVKVPSPEVNALSALSAKSDAALLLPQEYEEGSVLPETATEEYNRRMVEAYSSYLGGLPSMYRRVSEERHRVELRLMVDGLRDTLERESRHLHGAIERANRSVERGVDKSFRAGGYRKERKEYSREAIVDLDYFGHETERQRVEGYRYYSEPELLWESRLTELVAANGSYEEARGEYEGTLSEIAGRRALVFGNYAGDGSSLFSRVEQKTVRRFSSARERYRAAAGKDAREKEGLFFYHIGFAPVMDEDDPVKVAQKGYGELGRIYTDFYRQEYQYRRGLSMMEIPSWDRRLWDDDADNDGESDHWFSAPTTRQVVDLGVSASASLLLPPGLGQLAATMGDDLLFAAADTRMGKTSLAEASFRLGKSVAGSALTMGGSTLWKGAGASAVGGGRRTLLENVFGATGSSATSAVVSASLSGLGYTDTSGFSYDTEKFRESLLSGATLVTATEAVFGTVARNALHNRFLQDGKSYGFSSADTFGMREVGEFGIDMGSAALQYKLEGSLSFNLLGTDELFRGEGANTGLLRLDVGGDSAGGIGLSLGSGGIDLSAGRFGKVLRGVETMAVQRAIGAAVGSTVGGSGSSFLSESLLRFQHSFGDEAAQRLLLSLASGRDTLFVEEGGGENLLGHTVGAPQGGRDVYLFRSPRAGVGEGTEAALSHEAALLALVLQHEAHRDGSSPRDQSASGWSRELEQAVLAHSSMAARIASDPRYSHDFIGGNPALLLDMAVLGGGGSSSASKLASLYDNTDDYWRLSEEGFLEWDGSHHLWGADGRLMAVHERGSFSQDVADYLGVSRDRALDLMEKAGLSWSSEEGTYIQSGTSRGIPATEELRGKYDLMKKYGVPLGGDGLVDPRSAYAWELRERRLAEAYGVEPAHPSEESLLTSYETFLGSAGLEGRREFGGIRERVDLHHYSQQKLEEVLTGSPLDASKGDGYCLASSYAFSYVDASPHVDWDRLSSAFETADWAGNFDTSTGFVGDKTAFTRILSEELEEEVVAREYRYRSLEELQRSLADRKLGSGSLPSYSVIADYGGHFTHVRPDGREINSYPGWSPEGRDPEEWRLVTWEKMGVE